MRNGQFRRSRHLTRALVDPLEPRLLMTTISGTVYNDLNGNRNRDAGEPGLSGWVVYETRISNGAITSSSLRCVTDATGYYRLTYNFFSFLRPGRAYIRVATPAGWQLTEPSAGEYVTPLFGTTTYSGKNFGSRAIAAPGTTASSPQAASAPASATGSFFASGSTTATDDVLAQERARTRNAAVLF